MHKHANYQSTLKTSTQNKKNNFGSFADQLVMVKPNRKPNKYMTPAEMLSKGMKNIANGKE
jgi:hypothetical protein